MWVDALQVSVPQSSLPLPLSETVGGTRNRGYRKVGSDTDFPSIRGRYPALPGSPLSQFPAIRWSLNATVGIGVGAGGLSSGFPTGFHTLSCWVIRMSRGQ